MLWDVSWDQNNVIGGKRYSEYAFKELGRVTNTVPPITTQAPPPPVSTQAPSPPPVTTEAPPPPPVTTQAPPPPTGNCHNVLCFCLLCSQFSLKAGVNLKAVFPPV